MTTKTGKYPVGGFSDTNGSWRMLCKYRVCRNYASGDCQTCEHMTKEKIL